MTTSRMMRHADELLVRWGFGMETSPVILGYVMAGAEADTRKLTEEGWHQMARPGTVRHRVVVGSG
jgi:hypothetical protein